MNNLATPALEPRLALVPIGQLSPIAHGVRKTNGVKLDELIASIAAEGLLQNLTVIADPSSPLAGAEEFQNYQVIAGSRRLRALRELVKQGRLPVDYEVPCRVIDESQALTASLAENAIREPMHPADEYVAFRDMVAEGKSIEDIAARFGVTPLVVQRRLKLANVAPKIFEQFRQDKVTLDQMMALAISDDHKAQERALFKPEHPWKTRAHELRAALTKKDVDVEHDPVARFVGIDAYQRAGGAVKRDLFGKEGAGFITDVELLRKLATEKLQAVADQVTKEGWSFVRVADHVEHSELAEYSCVEPSGQHKPGDVERKQVKELTAERAAAEKRMRALNEIDPFNDSDEEVALRDRIEAIGDELDALERARDYYDPKILAKGGAIVTIEDGRVAVHRGLVKGKLRQAKDQKADAKAEGKAPAQQVGLTESLARELTAHATFAIAAEMVAGPNGHGIAMLALTHRLVLSQFYPGGGYESTGDRSIVGIKHDHSFPNKSQQTSRAEGLGGAAGTSPDLAKLATERKALNDLLPAKAAELLPWLLKDGATHFTRLLAYCVAESIDAVEGANSKGGKAAPLAAALKIDMTTRWTATADTYLKRVNAATVLAALKEAGADKTTLAKAAAMKKGELVTFAQPLLATWLPKPLRIGARA